MGDRPFSGGGARLKLHLFWQQVQGWRLLLVGLSAPSERCWSEGSRTQGTAAPAGLDLTYSLNKYRFSSSRCSLPDLKLLLADGVCWLRKVSADTCVGWVMQRNHCPAGREGSTPVTQAGATLILPEWLEPIVDEESLREWGLLSWELSSLCRRSPVLAGGTG